MELSNQNCDLVCLIRKQVIAATPEERVRQSILDQMIRCGGYSPHLIGIEVSLKALPSLSSASYKLPDRRADVIVFSQAGLAPLILIECKAHPINNNVKRQIIGYNAFVKAPILIIATPGNVFCGSLVKGEGWVFNAGLPSRQEAEDRLIQSGRCPRL